MVTRIHLSHAGCRDFSEDSVHLWAVNKLDAEAEGRHPLKPNSDGKLPVVNIKCHNLTVEQVLRNFVDAEMSFRLRAVADMPFQLLVMRIVQTWMTAVPVQTWSPHLRGVEKEALLLRKAGPKSSPRSGFSFARF